MSTYTHTHVNYSTARNHTLTLTKSYVSAPKCSGKWVSIIDYNQFAEQLVSRFGCEGVECNLLFKTIHLLQLSREGVFSI